MQDEIKIGKHMYNRFSNLCDKIALVEIVWLVVWALSALGILVQAK